MREKYFVLLEGSDRAILRTSVSAAVQKKKVKKIQSYLLACMFNAITSIDVTVANDLARNGYFDERGNPV